MAVSTDTQKKEVLSLFFNTENNTVPVIAEIVGLQPHQVNTIISKSLKLKANFKK